MTEPRTAAGWALLDRHGTSKTIDVLAIEAEARAAALDEARAAVRNVRRSRLVGPPQNRHLESSAGGHLLDLIETLAAIDALREDAER